MPEEYSGSERHFQPYAPVHNRRYKIDGHPVSKQEVLDQATMIRGNVVKSFGLALRILRNDGRDVTENEKDAG